MYPDIEVQGGFWLKEGGSEEFFIWRVSIPIESFAYHQDGFLVLSYFLCSLWIFGSICIIDCAFRLLTQVQRKTLFMTTCAFPSGTKGLVCLSHLRAQRFCVIILHIQRFFTIAEGTELWVYVPILCWKQQLGHNLTMSKKGLLTHNFLENHCHKKETLLYWATLAIEYCRRKKLPEILLALKKKYSLNTLFSVYVEQCREFWMSPKFWLA